MSFRLVQSTILFPVVYQVVTDSITNSIINESKTISTQIVSYQFPVNQKPMNQTSKIIIPYKLYFNEYYTYTVEISDTFSSQIKSSPSGQIKAIIQEKELRKIDRHDLQRANNQSIEGDFHQAVADDSTDIIRIDNYNRTDLDKRLSLGLNEDFLPLKTLLMQNRVVQLSQTRASHSDCTILIDYTPDDPENRLDFNIDVDIYDEVIERDDSPLEQYSDSSDHVKVSEQTVFAGALIFEFTIDLSSPSLKYSSIEELTISHFTLYWPHITSRQFLKLYQDDNEIDVMYEPESRSVKWNTIAFNEMPQDAEYKLFNSHNNQKVFRTPSIKLKVLNLDEFYNEKYLEGHFTINLPSLLSEIHPYVSDEQIDNPPNITVSTKIEINFKLSIEELFERKIFSPSQYLQFPNVVFSEMRILDIISLLRDMNFEIHRPHKLFPESQRRLIKAKRQESSGTLNLLIDVKGSSSGTKREKEIPGDEKFTTQFPTGNIIIFIQGQLEGDSYHVVKTINNIHRKLKERFRHVSIIK